MGIGLRGGWDCGRGEQRSYKSVKLRVVTLPHRVCLPARQKPTAAGALHPSTVLDVSLLKPRHSTKAGNVYLASRLEPANYDSIDMFWSRRCNICITHVMAR